MSTESTSAGAPVDASPTVDAAVLRRPWRVPLIAALALAFVSLALISGVAYIVVLAGATSTAERLLVDRCTACRRCPGRAGAKAGSIPSAEHLELIAALAAHGRLDINSPVDMREALWVMMTRVPAISSAAFATFDFKMNRVIRLPDGKVTRDSISLADLPRGLEQFRQLQTAHSTFWGTLFWSQLQQQPVLNVRTPVRRLDDAFIGGLLATVAVGDLSYLISEASRAAAAATSSWSGATRCWRIAG